MFSKFSCVVAGVGTSFLAVAEKYTVASLDLMGVVRLSAKGPLGCFHVWAVVSALPWTFTRKFLCGRRSHFPWVPTPQRSD